MTEACGCALPSAGSFQTAPTAPAACPTNHQVGQAVDTATLKAGLAVSLSWLTAAHYRFCRDPHCPAVYYSPDNGQTFAEADLRERVYQKHPLEDDSLVCYCFRHTVGSIRAELRQTGATTVVEAITAGLRAGQCACDLRNPQGRCCLGNVRALVAQLQADAGAQSV